MRRVVPILVLVLALVGGGAVVSSAEAASPLKLSIPTNRVDQKTTFSITASVGRLPSGSVVYVQRQFGTKKVYKNVASIGGSGSYRVPGVQQGRYAYRLAAFKGSKLVAASKPRTVYSYAEVSLADLCDRADSISFDECGSGTVPVGDQVFSYTHSACCSTGPDEDYDFAISAERSSCRLLSLDFAVANSASESTGVGASVTQEASDPSRAVVAPGTVGHIDVVLASPAWNLTLWSQGETDDVYFRGTASCYTSSGDA